MCSIGALEVCEEGMGEDFAGETIRTCGFFSNHEVFDDDNVAALHVTS